MAWWLWINIVKHENKIIEISIWAIIYTNMSESKHFILHIYLLLSHLIFNLALWL